MSRANTPTLKTERIQDPVIRENFVSLLKFLQQDTNLRGFEHFEIEIEAAVSHLKFPHNLGFVPLDVLVTSLIGAGAVTWNYSLFDDENLDLNTTGPVTIRAYVGTHVRGTL